MEEHPDPFVGLEVRRDSMNAVNCECMVALRGRGLSKPLWWIPTFLAMILC